MKKKALSYYNLAAQLGNVDFWNVNVNNKPWYKRVQEMIEKINGELQKTLSASELKEITRLKKKFKEKLEKIESMKSDLQKMIEHIYTKHPPKPKLPN